MLPVHVPQSQQSGPAPPRRSGPSPGWLPVEDGDPTRIGPYSAFGALPPAPRTSSPWASTSTATSWPCAPRPGARSRPCAGCGTRRRSCAASRAATRRASSGRGSTRTPVDGDRPGADRRRQAGPTLDALLHDGTVARWDDRTRATVGMRLAEALDLCAALGIVHRDLGPDVVLVRDVSVRIIRWTKGVLDGRDRYRTENVHALGRTFLALAGGDQDERRYRRRTADQQWPTASWDPLRALARRCLSPTRAGAPPRQLADAFAERLGPAVEG
ncbi:hypothetical protein NKH77_41370 [Streptomyces sp. M19]